MSESRNIVNTLASTDPMVIIEILQSQLNEANRKRNVSENSLAEFRKANTSLPELYAERTKMLLTENNQLREQIKQLKGIPKEYSKSSSLLQVNEENIHTEKILRDKLFEANNKLNLKNKEFMSRETEYRLATSRLIQDLMKAKQLAQEQSQAHTDELNQNKNRYQSQIEKANAEITTLTELMKNVETAKAKISKHKLINDKLLKISTVKIAELTADLERTKAQSAEIKIRKQEVLAPSVFKEAIVAEALVTNAKLKNELENKQIAYQNVSQQLQDTNNFVEQLELQLAVANASVENIREQSKNTIAKLEEEQISKKKENSKIIDDLRVDVMAKQTEINLLLRNLADKEDALSSKRKREANKANQALTDSYELKVKNIEFECHDMSIINANHKLNNVRLMNNLSKIKTDMKNQTVRVRNYFDIMTGKLKLIIAKKDIELTTYKNDAEARENYIVQQMQDIAEMKQALIAKTQALDALAVNSNTQTIFCKYINRISYLETECTKMQKNIDYQKATISDLVTRQCQVMPIDEILDTESPRKKIKINTLVSQASYSPTLFAPSYPHLRDDDNAPPTLTLDDMPNMQLN